MSIAVARPAAEALVPAREFAEASRVRRPGVLDWTPGGRPAGWYPKLSYGE